MIAARINASRSVIHRTGRILTVRDRLMLLLTVPVAKQAWQSSMSTRERLAQIPSPVVRSSVARLCLVVTPVPKSVILVTVCRACRRFRLRVDAAETHLTSYAIRKISNLLSVCESARQL